MLLPLRFLIRAREQEEVKQSVVVLQRVNTGGCDFRFRELARFDNQFNGRNPTDLGFTANLVSFLSSPFLTLFCHSRVLHRLGTMRW